MFFNGSDDLPTPIAYVFPLKDNVIIAARRRARATSTRAGIPWPCGCSGLRWRSAVEEFQGKYIVLRNMCIYIYLYMRNYICNYILYVMIYVIIYVYNTTIIHGTYYIYVDYVCIENYHLVVPENLANIGAYFILGLPPWSHMRLERWRTLPWHRSSDVLDDRMPSFLTWGRLQNDNFLSGQGHAEMTRAHHWPFKKLWRI